MEPKDRATPVRVSTPTTMPEPASTAATSSQFTDAPKASSIFLGGSQVLRPKKLRIKVIQFICLSSYSYCH